MTHAPLFALRALWAHGGAAQAFVARDQQLSERLARLTRDVVPDCVLHDGDAVQTLAATTGLDRILGAAFAPDGRSDGSDTRTDERQASRDRGDRRQSRAVMRGDDAAAGTRDGAAGVGTGQAPWPGAGEQGSGIARAPSSRERAGGQDHGAPGIVDVISNGVRAQSTIAPAALWSARHGGSRDADNRSTTPSAAQREQFAPSGQAGRRWEPLRVGDRRPPRPPVSGAAATEWRAVAPLVATLSDESRRQVAEILARSGQEGAVPATLRRRASTRQYGAGAGEDELIGQPSLLELALDALERRRSARTASPGELVRVAPGDQRSGASFSTQADARLDALVDARAVSASSGPGGFRALASYTIGMDDAPAVRAPFLSHAAARRVSSPIAMASERDVHDVHHVLVAAARAEGLDLDEVTS